MFWFSIQENENKYESKGKTQEVNEIAWEVPGDRRATAGSIPDDAQKTRRPDNKNRKPELRESSQTSVFLPCCVYVEIIRKNPEARVKNTRSGA